MRLTFGNHHINLARTGPTTNVWWKLAIGGLNRVGATTFDLLCGAFSYVLELDWGCFLVLILGLSRFPVL